MRSLPAQRRELIDALVAETDIGGITAGLLEKDEHLTAALHAVFALEFEHASLVFCGGTSLAKAHGLIERMSEDADIKLVLSAQAASWPPSRLRRYLGDEVRAKVTGALESLGLVEDVALRRSLNNNRYVHSQWAYARAYDGMAALRPHIQIEWVVRSPVLTTEKAVLGALTDRLAGRSGVVASVAVVAVAETLAEKVLSYLRRFALHRSGQMQQSWDMALARHIYDAHCIVLQRPDVVDDAVTAFVALTHGDVQEFGYQDPAFAQNPKAVLLGALTQAEHDQQTRNEYDEGLLPLVYGTRQHPFEQAWGSFAAVARQMIAALN